MVLIIDNKTIGVVGIFISLILLVISMFVTFFFLIYAIPILIISLIIIFNKKEDVIEQIKK